MSAAKVKELGLEPLKLATLLPPIEEDEGAPVRWLTGRGD